MSLFNKIKGKVFPDEKEVLYYSDKENNEESSSPIYSTHPSNTFYSPSNFSQTRILSDKLKAGNVITIDVSNMDKKEALRMIDFLGGVMYALDGDMKKISKNIFEFSILKERK